MESLNNNNNNNSTSNTSNKRGARHHRQSIMGDASNSIFVQPTAASFSLERGKGARSRQSKASYRPSLNSSDLIDSSSHGGGGSGASGSNGKKSKNLSLNHLLNFSFPERQSYSSPSKRSSQPAFNKERFVNAKYFASHSTD